MSRSSKRLPKSLPAVGIPSGGTLINPDRHQVRPEDVPKLKQMETAPFVPVGCKVALILYDMGKVTEGGIILPDSIKDYFDTQIALVLAVGPECKQVKPGDRVLLFTSVPRGIIRYRRKRCEMIDEDAIVSILSKEEVIELPFKEEM